MKLGSRRCRTATAHAAGALLLSAGLFATSASAGDTANLNILGFSKDGRVFAFEESGTQDGSGFPYASRFYIDTTSEGFLPGTPIRVRLETERATEAEARQRAKERGETIVPQAELDANPGYTAAFNPPTELSSDPHRIVASPRPIFPTPDEPAEFRIEELPFHDAANCPDGEVVGFRLIRADASGGGASRVLHEDKSVPRSRNCPLGYRIAGLQTFGLDGLVSYAVLVSVRSQGFEGPDYRWLAVAGRF